ncbi:hypothetical protein WJX81_003966 [Elliptochloris bilobata]|uniref:Glutaredoxin domain-containing protein n=1 Tax=Elliptochloris bilobata TaxID=381761 RepID=A0AAW1SCB2_9CHLO
MSTPQQIVAQKTADNPVFLFVIRGCANCIALKRTIDKEYRRSGYKFMELDKLPGMESTALMDYLKEITGVDKQPWLFLKGKCLGKYDDIEKLQRAGELKALLKEAGG